MTVAANVLNRMRDIVQEDIVARGLRTEPARNVTPWVASKRRRTTSSRNGRDMKVAISTWFVACVR